MLDAFKLKEFDLEPVFESWKNPPRFLGNPKKDPPVDTWLDQVKEGCLERKVPKEYWHKVGQRFLGDKARKRLAMAHRALESLERFRSSLGGESGSSEVRLATSG